MALDIKKDSSVVGERAFPPGESLRFVRPIKNLLELVPGPAIFWSLKRHFCIPNRKAHQWIASAKNDFREYASNWTRKVHRLDRPRFLAVWEQLQLQETVACDYRLAPDGLEQETWIREVSACYRNWRGEAEGLISVYTDVSDLKSAPLIEEAESVDIPSERPALRGLAHDIANCIHNISMELELMSLKSQAPAPVELLDSLNRLQWSMRQLLEYRMTEGPEPVSANFRPFPEEMIRRFQRRLYPCGVELEFYSDETLPEVKIGVDALYQILEQLVDYYCAQLKAPAKLKMELCVVGGTGGEQLEVKLSPGHGFRQEESVQPFLQLDDHRVTVSTAVAREILRHHREKISFAMPGAECGALTVRFDVVKQPAA